MGPEEKRTFGAYFHIPAYILMANTNDSPNIVQKQEIM